MFSLKAEKILMVYKANKGSGSDLTILVRGLYSDSLHWSLSINTVNSYSKSIFGCFHKLHNNCTVYVNLYVNLQVVQIYTGNKFYSFYIFAVPSLPQAK